MVYRIEEELDVDGITQEDISDRNTFRHDVVEWKVGSR